MWNGRSWCLSFAAASALALLLTATPLCHARVKLESICSVHGQRPIRLTGMGLVVGLDGTGDGKAALPTMQALQRVLNLMGNQATIGDAENAAIVMVEATVPATSLRAGQPLDVYVSSMISAKSLRGGRLLVTPLQTVDRRSTQLVATAGGAISLEDKTLPTTGRIPGGAILEADFFREADFLKNVISEDSEGQPYLTLTLDPDHASFISAANVSSSINQDFRDLAYGENVARPVGPGTIEVTIPNVYRGEPVEFIAEILDVGIDRPHTQARVVVNAKSNVVVVTGEVEISPVVISHPGLQVEIGSSFRPLTDPNQGQTTVQLRQLVDALSQLQVPTADVIDIIRELKRSGKLHAVYEEQ